MRTHGFLQPKEMGYHYKLHNTHGHPRVETEATNFARVFRDVELTLLKSQQNGNQNKCKGKVRVKEE